jgi:tetratricopeptide (TPR) repeat protein
MTYKSMLRYTVEGISDPERQKIYNRTLTNLFSLADDVYLAYNKRFGNGIVYELRRKYASSTEDYLAVTIGQCLEGIDKWKLMGNGEALFPDMLNNSLQTVFELLLSGNDYYTREEVVIRSLFMEDSLPWPQQCVMTSAVSIHLLSHFNLPALDLLFSLAAHPHIEVKQRAIVGLMLVLFKYDKRLPFYPDIIDKLHKLNSGKLEKSILQTVVIQLMRTRETEKLARKLTDEILPEVARIHPNIRNRLDLDNIIGEKFMEGKNPDWEDIFLDSPGLMDKLEEFSRLQMEGSDLFLSTFRMLKHFPFFNHADKWFLPFSYPNPIVNEILKDESGPFKNPDLIQGMADSGVLCNSDKYSLILSIPMMPSAQKEMMGQMFLAEMGAISEIEKSEELIGPEKKALSVSNQYIQDLYRFFRVYPKREAMEDPFSTPLDFHNCFFVGEVFAEDGFYLKLGSYLFEKDRFKEAQEVFITLFSQTIPDMQLLQKLAYCHQQLHEHEQALQYYLQADLFDHSQVWNLKKVALCYRQLKNPEKALEYYKEAERVSPDNLHTQVSIGHCLLETKNFEEALKYYFKVEYLDPKNKKVWRPIVWCALALGKFDLAEKYSKKLIDDSPTHHDFMNMGHVKWCEGKRKEALKWYQKSIKHPGNSLNEFLEAFKNDLSMLIGHEVDESDIPIMMDQLRYYLSE